MSKVDVSIALAWRGVAPSRHFWIYAERSRHYCHTHETTSRKVLGEFWILSQPRPRAKVTPHTNTLNPAPYTLHTLNPEH